MLQWISTIECDCQLMSNDNKTLVVKRTTHLSAVTVSRGVGLTCGLLIFWKIWNIRTSSIASGVWSGAPLFLGLGEVMIDDGCIVLPWIRLSDSTFRKTSSSQSTVSNAFFDANDLGNLAPTLGPEVA